MRFSQGNLAMARRPSLGLSSSSLRPLFFSIIVGDEGCEELLVRARSDRDPSGRNLPFPFGDFNSAFPGRTLFLPSHLLERLLEEHGGFRGALEFFPLVELFFFLKVLIPDVCEGVLTVPSRLPSLAALPELCLPPPHEAFASMKPFRRPSKAR